MLAKAFVDNAKVMSKGQITIPKDVRTVLGVSNGDRVTFVVTGDKDFLESGIKHPKAVTAAEFMEM